MAHLALSEVDEGIDALHKETELYPLNVQTYKVLGRALTYLHRPEEALAVWRHVLALDQKDRDAAENVGAILLSSKRYDEAALELEEAVKLNPDIAELHFELANAYVKASKLDYAMPHYHKAIGLSPELGNDAAYLLAEANAQLPEALQMSQKAVAYEEQASSRINLDSLTTADLKHASALAQFWDTLGWVYFRLAQYDKAERYLAAAWSLSQDAIIGDHLGQVYEKMAKRQLAIHTYALSFAAKDTASEARMHLFQLVGSETKSDMLLTEARGELSSLRTTKLANVPDRGSAEFFVLFTASRKPTVKFISGEEKLRSLQNRLADAHYNLVFPDDGEGKILRRGILACPKEEKGCDFALIPLEGVHSVK
jgi:tetratricopeptide (TPR) repeat protein